MHRHAFTLIELVISLAAASMLAAGLAGALYISSQALSGGGTSARQSLEASTVLRDLMGDVSHANSFTERTAHAITFTVPDRNGDLAPEIIRYAWTGTAGDSLTYQYNGGSTVDLATDVRAFNLSALTRVLTASSVTAPVAANVVFEEFTEAKVTSVSTLISIAKPPGATDGDLLIASVVTYGDSRASLTAPAGWNQLFIGAGSYYGYLYKPTLSVWWKLASSSDPSAYSFSWSSSSKAYGWIMRFTGHDATNPIDTSAGTSGSATTAPPCPAVTTTVENTMIVRIGGFEDDDITTDSPGLPGHTVITMDASDSGASNCSGGAGYLTQATAGDSGTSSFALTASEEYATVTIAIAPNTSN